LRRSQKAILIFGGLAALLATGISAIPTQATPSQIDALRAQRAQLVAQLAALQPNLNAAGGAVSEAERAYNAQQAKVLGLQARLNNLNNQMLTLSRQIADDQATIAKDKRDLGAIVRATYESSGSDQTLAAILSANNFQQAMDRLRTANHISQQVSDLVQRLAARDVEMHAEQVQVQNDFAQASTLEGQVAAERNKLLEILLTRNGEFDRLTGPARAIGAQIANIDEQIAFLQAGPHVGSSPCGNGFAYGNCTWYVANRRCVPWGGNARDWYYNAAAFGFKEGNSPLPGAVIVFWPGGDGASPVWGHVGYVEAVGPASGIPAGYFRLSEMNATAGWNRVDYRTLANNDGGIQGFVYDHA
jgi:surface antigen/peptidoglycan hydrolase CwlO-like protein